uniref:DUF148 domain-containing protein n=1 Tax=Panagrellus redivivus TaxID=6233 RepID=A0A7E4UYI0_PANRE
MFLKGYILILFATIVIIAAEEDEEDPDDVDVRHAMVEKYFKDTGMTKNQLKELNKLIDKVGILDADKLERAVVKYSRDRYDDEKHAKVLAAVETIKKEFSYLSDSVKNLFGKVAEGLRDEF